MKTLQATSPYEAACFALKDHKDEDPFYILDRSDLCKKVALWTELMPRIKPFYAVKCNPEPEILKILVGLGLGFDVASLAEMQSCLELGVDPSKLIFAQPSKIPSHLLFAKNYGVKKMTFDSEDELHKIKNIYPEAHILLRARYDGDTHLSLGDKFGVLPENCAELLKLAKKLQLNLVGVAFHVGSAVQDAKSYAIAIAGCRGIIDQAKSIGFTPSILDIGGGFPQLADDLFTTMATAINQALDQYFPHDEPIEIMGEPGRYIAGTSLSLVTMIHSRRLLRTSDGKIKTVMYYITDGIYGSFRSVPRAKRILYPKPIRKTHTSGDDTSIDSIVWGPTCDSFDKLSSSMNLPLLSVGDYIHWSAMGDYTTATQTNFNGYPKALVKYCIN